MLTGNNGDIEEGKSNHGSDEEDDVVSVNIVNFVITISELGHIQPVTTSPVDEIPNLAQNNTKSDDKYSLYA